MIPTTVKGKILHLVDSLLAGWQTVPCTVMWQSVWVLLGGGRQWVEGGRVGRGGGTLKWTATFS